MFSWSYFPEHVIIIIVAYNPDFCVFIFHLEILCNKNKPNEICLQYVLYTV